MNENQQAMPRHVPHTKTAEELIGVLTAISVVSGRMARKLAILKQRSARRGGEKPDAKRAPGDGPAAHAHQSHSL
jgi:hypothetical protein